MSFQKFKKRIGPMFDRGSPSEVFLEKDVPKISSKFSGEDPC